MNSDAEDAKRYRWLKAQRGLELQSLGQSSQWIRPDGTKFYSSHMLLAGNTAYGAYETLDETIDAAIYDQESRGCCHQTMLLGYRCAGCPHAVSGDILIPRRN